MNRQLFSPYETLAFRLLPCIETGYDGAHDLSHIARVWHNALTIQAEEGGDAEIVAAAVLLHDCVFVPKNSPQRPHASRLAAVKATAILQSLDWAAAKVAAVAHAIEVHSFSAAVEALTLEACILQDADRLDAIGVIGIARCFYTAGRMGSELYNAQDPLGERRELDDSRFALDHFPKKLLQLSGGFKTAAGRRLATRRHEQVRCFYEQLTQQIG